MKFKLKITDHGGLGHANADSKTYSLNIEAPNTLEAILGAIKFGMLKVLNGNTESEFYTDVLCYVGDNTPTRFREIKQRGLQCCPIKEILKQITEGYGIQISIIR